MRCYKKVLILLSLVILVFSMTACSAAEKTKEIISDVQTEDKFSRSEEETSSAKQTDDVDQESAQKDEKSEEENAESKPEVTEDVSSEDAAALATPSTSGALHVEGTQLKDSKGNNVQLRGISTHGLSWFPQYVNQELFQELHNDWKANVMRLAMYTAENGGYCTDGNKENLKKLVKDGVAYATNADMYVIIDWHVLRDENPNTHKEEAKKFFDEMSKEYANADNVIYEICNEPNGSTSWSEVKTYAEEIIPVIRANDENALIIVGTPTWCQDVDKAAEDPITEYDNIMYSLHFYATTHTDWLRDRMNQAIDSGLPIFVSEFGTCDASGNGAFDEYQSNEWIKALDAKGVSYVTWNLSNKNETSSIFADGCSKTSGFTQDDLSQNGKWVYTLLTGDREVGNSEQTEQEGESDSSEQEAQEETVSDEQTDDTAVSGTCDGIKYTAKVTGSWESDGKTFYQYVLELENTSEEEMDGWEIEISFSDNIEFSDGWNGDYSVSGKQLKIKSKDYNGKLSAGAKTGDIGFIISGETGLELE
ncbi:MAG: glycoside hydrolase family 5 protein [Lachnospiraceae bacterium]|nr:glycoside hydrolase family 5 protein [Lachnospiraceae bacterium]